MIEPPCKTAKDYFHYLCAGFFTTSMFALIALPVITQLKKEDPDYILLSTVLWAGLLFFLLGEIGILYIYLTHVFYYSSDIQIDTNGLQRVYKGKIKEEIKWNVIDAYYVNFRHTPAESDWIVVTNSKLKKPTNRLFKVRGFFGIKLNPHILIQFSYTPQKEAALSQYADKRVLCPKEVTTIGGRFSD